MARSAKNTDRSFAISSRFVPDWLKNQVYFVDAVVIVHLIATANVVVAVVVKTHLDACSDSSDKFSSFTSSSKDTMSSRSGTNLHRDTNKDKTGRSATPGFSLQWSSKV